MKDNYTVDNEIGEIGEEMTSRERDDEGSDTVT